MACRLGVLLGVVASSLVQGAIQESQCAAFPTVILGGRPTYFSQPNSHEFFSTGHEETAELVLGSHEAAEAPQVAVVLVLPSSVHAYRVSKDAFPSLYAAVGASASSRVISCMTRTSSDTSSVGHAYKSVAGADSSIDIPYHELEGFVARDGLQRDEKLKLVVSRLPEDLTIDSIDQLASKISNALASVVPDGRYIVIQAPEFPTDHPVAPRELGRGRTRYIINSHQQMQRMTDEHRKLLVEDDTNQTIAYYKKQYLYATPNLVAGLLTVLFFLAVLWTAVQCLMDLQTPSKFVKEKLPEGKQF